MNRISICFPYYLNAGMLAQQYEAIRTYGKEHKANIEVIVVDDGSPRDFAADVFRPDGLPRLRIFRMDEDVRWNQDACRNLAASQAEHEWLLLTDIDHVIPAQTIRRLCEMKLNPGTAYKFSRVSAPDLSPYKPHPNSWLMTRTLYDRVGGYDERFAGYYGTDAMFRDGINRIAPIVLLKDTIIRFPREVIPDASTTTYTRKEDWDGENIRRIKSEIAALPAKDQRPKRGRFSWSQVL